MAPNPGSDTLNYLVLTPQLPYPPRQGAAIRNWGIISQLARSHQVHLLSFGELGGDPPPGLASSVTVPPPKRQLRDRLRDLLATPEPDMARRLYSPAFAAALDRLLDRHDFDVVQVEGIELLSYALPYLDQPGGPIWVYDAHNAETDLQRSALRADLRHPRRWHAALYSALQVLKLKRYEATYLKEFDLVLSVSEEDARLLAGLSGVRPVVIPNGIDTEQLAPGMARPAAEMQARPGPALLFTGKMDFRPNVDGVLWFVDEILPRIPHEGTPPTLWVVGQQPHSLLDRLRDHPQVLLTGWVDAVEPYIAGADLVVVPLRMGSGTRLKVLQAMSMGRPVVGTTLGCAGLDVRSGEQLMLADEPATFAAAVGKLLCEPEEAMRLAAAGRRHVVERFDWRVLVPRFEEELRRRSRRTGRGARGTTGRP